MNINYDISLYLQGLLYSPGFIDDHCTAFKIASSVRKIAFYEDSSSSIRK